MGITKCDKCSGCIVQDTFSLNFQWIPGTRCLNCGRVKFAEEKVEQHADKTKDRGTDRMDELELYRTRRRSPKCYSYHVQH
jgi:hypothetical protein